MSPEARGPAEALNTETDRACEDISEIIPPGRAREGRAEKYLSDCQTPLPQPSTASSYRIFNRLFSDPTFALLAPLYSEP